MENLTNEEKNRILMLYHGCEVTTSHPNYPTCRIYGACEASITIRHDVEGFDTIRGTQNDVKLLLTPIENITGEDAIEVGKILGEIPSSYSAAHISEYIDYLIWLFEGNNNKNNERQIDSDYLGWRIVEAADYLRSKGYALLYKGQSLFDLGIAIEKQ